jgi:uncharacterized protein (TIGR01777 family)
MKTYHGAIPGSEDGMKYAITGATGFVGSRLVELILEDPGSTVLAFTRDPDRARGALPGRPGRIELAAWDYAASPPPDGSLEGADAVIHLAGENVGLRRWSAAQKKRIRESRVLSTRNLITGLTRASRKPSVLVCASAVGFYGPRGDEEIDESATAGNDFLADVCQDWEMEAERAALHGVREARIRIGVVLGPGGGALKPLLLAFKLFAGGPVGNGRQWMSWIHRDDLARLFIHAARTPSLSGAVNGTAPNAVRNKEFARTLGRVLHRPAILPAPRLGLRIVLGEFADVLVTGQRVVPRKALESGFEFRHPELEGALRDVLGGSPAPGAPRSVPAGGIRSEAS